jgi:HAD superfamily hydrolase (TIGR01484 family)
VRYLALATDYDGTLATDGTVDRETVAALRRIAATGRKLILVTGRQLSDLLHVFPDATLFDAIVAENGAVLYRPASRETRVLAPRPSAEFVEALRRRGVAPLWVGQVVVATVQPNEASVFDVIRELGLDLRVILNKGSVMVLPASVDKASGLRAALDELALSPRDVVAIGDAENDQAFLAICGCGVAVANALDALKAGAGRVTRAAAGAGVREIIDSLIAEDLRRDVRQ